MNIFLAILMAIVLVLAPFAAPVQAQPSIEETKLFDARGTEVSVLADACLRLPTQAEIVEAGIMSGEWVAYPLTQCVASGSSPAEIVEQVVESTLQSVATMVTPVRTPITTALPRPTDEVPTAVVTTAVPDPEVTETPTPQETKPPVVVETPAPDKGKANCGVGNGVDGDTKGCDEWQNDGPSDVPGNPGHKGGKP